MAKATEKSLQNVHAFATGASSGLGLTMAEALLREGAAVALSARKSEQWL
ncbi:SDR family NAD(P)-dependent oxidoreductase [Aneurinibacillus terranovensis]|nr:SDR family NAD(P)-dependent oxidoreductase [Aneurinibacillus terranovensis]